MDSTVTCNSLRYYSSAADQHLNSSYQFKYTDLPFCSKYFCFHELVINRDTKLAYIRKIDSLRGIFFQLLPFSPVNFHLHFIKDFCRQAPDTADRMSGSSNTIVQMLEHRCVHAVIIECRIGIVL